MAVLLRQTDKAGYSTAQCGFSGVMMMSFDGKVAACHPFLRGVARFG